MQFYSVSTSQQAKLRGAGFETADDLRGVTVAELSRGKLLSEINLLS